MGLLKDKWKAAVSQFQTLVPKNDQKDDIGITKLFLQTLEKIETLLGDCDNSTDKVTKRISLSAIEKNKAPLESHLKLLSETLKKRRDLRGFGVNKTKADNWDRALKLLVKEAEFAIATMTRDIDLHKTAKAEGDEFEKKRQTFKLMLKKHIAEGVAFIAMAKSVLTAHATKGKGSLDDVDPEQLKKLDVNAGFFDKIPVTIDQYLDMLKKHFPQTVKYAEVSKSSFGRTKADWEKLKNKGTNASTTNIQIVLNSVKVSSTLALEWIDNPKIN